MKNALKTITDDSSSHIYHKKILSNAIQNLSLFFPTLRRCYNRRDENMFIQVSRQNLS